MRLRLDTVQMADGRQTTREIVEHRNCVVIVPIDNDGNILLIKQFRQAVGKELLEIPAGGIEAGEEPIAAVVREMREETGYQPGEVLPLGGFYSSPGYCTEYLHLFTASHLVHSPLTAEDTPEIKAIPVPANRIPHLIAHGEIQDAKSIAGLLAYLYVKR